MKHIVLSVAVATSLATGVATAVVSKDLAYPSGSLSANDIAPNPLRTSEPVNIPDTAL